MATPELAPRRTIGGIVAAWIAAAVIGLSIGIFVAPEWRAAWLMVGLGGCLILSFAVQLGYGRSQGFTQRVAVSVLGSLLVLGVVSAGFGLATVIPA
ncbi:hypothetical protein [uncultured Microbacterium sp.]|uniref:hypothetical protein n=1 Tax=uncultured Microbacterium sp. TaxID=191216 RepID=UPI0035CC1296